MSKGKIGIFLPGARGDIGLATCVLKYKDVLWPDKDVIWFCGLLPGSTNVDMLKFNDAITEIRHWPEGYGLPERCGVDGPLAVARGEPMWEDFSVLKTENNRLHQTLKYDFESTKDLDEGYFPGTWLMPHRPKGTRYSEVARIVCGADPSWEWHPYLGFSNEEREMAAEFRATLPHDKTIMLETFMVSGDTHWNDDMTRNTMRLCREKFGRCNFIFATNRDNSRFFDDDGVVSGAQFTVRQLALVFNHCDLFVGVCSGISVAVSCWGNKAIPRIEWCGSDPISIAPIANGPVETVMVDDNPRAEQDLELLLKRLLEKF